MSDQLEEQKKPAAPAKNNRNERLPNHREEEKFPDEFIVNNDQHSARMPSLELEDGHNNAMSAKSIDSCVSERRKKKF